MNYLKKVPVIASTAVLIIAGILCVYYFITAVHNTSPSSVNLSEISTIRDEIKNSHPDVEDLKVYNRFNRVNFDFNLGEKVAEDEIAEIVKQTRELILQEELVNKLSDKDNPSLRIHLVLNSGKDVYEYEGNRDEDAAYKIWHFRKNGGDETSVVFD